MGKPDPTKDSTGAAAGNGLPYYVPSGPRNHVFYTDADEIAKLVLLVSFCNPDEFQNESTKAVIYKCKAATESTGERRRRVTFTHIRYR